MFEQHRLNLVQQVVIHCWFLLSSLIVTNLGFREVVKIGIDLAMDV